jgi:hypothetical protein
MTDLPQLGTAIRNALIAAVVMVPLTAHAQQVFDPAELAREYQATCIRHAQQDYPAWTLSAIDKFCRCVTNDFVNTFTAGEIRQILAGHISGTLQNKFLISNVICKSKLEHGELQ